MEGFLKELPSILVSAFASSLVLQVFCVIFATLFCSFLSQKFLNKVYLRSIKTKNIWDDCFFSEIRRPVKWFILVVGITYAIELAGSQVEIKIFNIAQPIRDVAIVIISANFLFNFIKKAESQIIKQRKERGQDIDLTTMNAIVRLIRASIIITAILILMQTFGIDITGILAFGGISGIAVGFAAKDMLANFFGAIMIYLDKPFAVGEWVRSPDREIEGIVEFVGWRQTCIITFDRRPIYIPNSVFGTIIVENPSRMENRKIKEIIGVRYEDIKILPKIIAETKVYLEKNSNICQEKGALVNLIQFADSSVNFIVQCYTNTTDWIEYNEVKQAILFKISDIVDKHDASIAFPTMTLDLSEGVSIKSKSKK
jgi:MscS family membrane protein